MFAATSQPIHFWQSGATTLPTRPIPQPISRTTSSFPIPTLSWRNFKVSCPVASKAASSVTPITCNFACSSVVERADQTFLYSERAGCCSIRRYLARDCNASIALVRSRTRCSGNQATSESQRMHREKKEKLEILRYLQIFCLRNDGLLDALLHMHRVLVKQTKFLAFALIVAAAGELRAQGFLIPDTTRRDMVFDFA